MAVSLLSLLSCSKESSFSSSPTLVNYRLDGNVSSDYLYYDTKTSSVWYNGKTYHLKRKSTTSITNISIQGNYTTVSGVGVFSNEKLRSLRLDENGERIFISNLYK